MIKIPYGKSDFKTLIEEEYFYQDRTSYIQTLENWDDTRTNLKSFVVVVAGDKLEWRAI